MVGHHVNIVVAVDDRMSMLVVVAAVVSDEMKDNQKAMKSIQIDRILD